MYEKVDGGASKVVGYDDVTYEFNFPPEGYVYNNFTGELEARKIFFSEEDKPMWRRFELPPDYKKKRASEKIKQKANPDFQDEDLADFRYKEWDKVINGCWVSIYNPCKSSKENIYLTGFNYFLLNWWKIPEGYPKFRYIHTEMCWMLEYARQHPKCYGVNAFGGRRFGKTVLGTAFMFYGAFKAYSQTCGMQSKTEGDVKKVFEKLVKSFKKLPDFLIPTYDKNSQFKKNIEFAVSAKDSIEKGIEALDSVIDFKESGELAYDGFKLDWYYGDEVGKTIQADVWERWKVLKPCFEEKGEGRKVIGTAFLTTTIEPKHDVARSYFDLLDKSFLMAKNDRTESGLFNYFIPADVVFRYDKYGWSLREEARAEILEERKIIEDPKDLMDAMRKDPLTIKEAKMVSVSGNPFNQQVLDDFKTKHFNLVDQPYVVGNFEWNGDLVEFQPDAINGRWHVAWMPSVENQNRFTKGYDGKYYPDYHHVMVAGVDPISLGSTATSKQKSSLACVIYRKSDMDLQEGMQNMFVADYIHSPDNPYEGYEDIRKALFFYGAKVLIERSNFDIYNYLKDVKNSEQFAMKKPESTIKNITTRGATQEIGIAANNETINYWISLLKRHIVEVNKKPTDNFIKLPRIVNQLFDYTPELRTKLDLSVAAGHALMAAEKIYEPELKSNKDISMLWDNYL